MEREERCGGEDNLGEKRMLGFEDKREADGAEQAMFEWVWACDCEVEEAKIER